MAKAKRKFSTKKLQAKVRFDANVTLSYSQVDTFSRCSAGGFPKSRRRQVVDFTATSRKHCHTARICPERTRQCWGVEKIKGQGQNKSTASETTKGHGKS
jgi:hypothetical protein